MTKRVIIAFSGWGDKNAVKDAFLKLSYENFSIAQKIHPITSMSVTENVDGMIKYLFGIEPSTVTNQDEALKGVKYSFKNPQTLYEVRDKIEKSVISITENRHFWTYMLERIILDQFKQWGNTGGVILLPDVSLQSHVKMLGRMKKRDIEVYHYAVLSKDTLPEWLNLGLEPWTGDMDVSLIRENYPDVTANDYEWCLSNPHMTNIITLDDVKTLNEQIRNKIIDHIWK